MAFQPVTNTVQVELLWTYQGQECENTLYFQRNSEWDEATMTAFGGAVLASAIATLLPGGPNSAVLRGVRVTDLTTDFAPSVEVPLTPPQGGSSSVQAAPNNVTLAITFRTSARGRTARGRNYIVGIQEDEVGNNIVSPSAINRWLAFYDELVSAPFQAVATWVVVSRWSNKVKRTLGLPRPIVSYGPTDDVVDSMRKRLPGRGT